MVTNTAHPHSTGKSPLLETGLGGCLAGGVCVMSLFVNKAEGSAKERL